jgi:dipeptidyl aminopeptidase/acylaminoacyl peptidase
VARSADGSRPARQITFGERGESQPTWSPDGSTLAFVSARGAGEDVRAQIHLLRLEGGEAERLTDVKDGVTGFAWSPDGGRIAFLSTDSLPRATEAARRRRDDPQVFEGDQRLSHVWVVDLGTKQTRELVHSAQYTVQGAPSWSPDGARLAYLTAPTTLIRDYRRAAYVVPAAGGAPERLDVSGDPQAAPRWSPDGRTIALTTIRPTLRAMADSISPRELMNEHLVLYDVAARTWKDVAHAEFDNSPGTLVWAPDSRAIYFTAGDRVWSSVFRFDVGTGRYAQLTRRQVVRGLAFSKDGQRAAMAIESTAAPAEVYVSDATFATPRQLTTTNPQLAQLALGESEVITWKSSDGQEVEGVLLKPVGWRPGQRVPLHVEVHGGPTGVHTAGFKASYGSPGQYWAGQGWATLYPNPRGSTGYGEKFMRGNIPDWGGGDYRDIMSGVDAVVQRGVADPERLAESGWSYGGYMTAWIVTQTKRFKAAMMGAGLSDLVSMYGTTDIPGYIGTFFDGNPRQQTLDAYWKRSPIRYVDNVTTPLLILHGGSDQRVPIGQPMEFYRGLKDRGKTVELVFYPREGHGLSEYYHQLDKIRRQYEWIARHTLGAPAQRAAATSGGR